ncbi:putative pentatricopeptide repeat-containing protein At1g56570 [Telopea speciosissima]|uniref:putative pentatricopeptide repeat-containing protein At1g56570 n=1 Tax=Telopea speciosissima TaxID=54955 RepID=UPI001CC34335|nr:putative pentatricopeptide repeat-containing protein At1g56570 [Telopea speciosissima]
MALNVILTPGVFLSHLQCHSIANDKIGNSNVRIPSTATQNSPVALGSKISARSAVSATDQLPKLQFFVDHLRDCAREGSIREGKVIHALVLKSSFDEKKTIVLLNHVADMYSKCSDFAAARVVFDKMPQKNVFSWTVMIVGSTENRQFDDGLTFFREMQGCGILPDKFTYSAVIQSCIGLNCIELCEMVHAQIIKKGFLAHIFVTTSLLNMYSKLGKIEDSVLMFNTMAEHNQVSWNAIISGFISNGLHAEAFNQFLAMKSEGTEPNSSTFGSVLKAVAKLGDVSKGREVHNHITELGMESNVLVGTALIDMYSNCGCLPDARNVFDKNFTDCRVNMPWNALVSGYSQCGCSQEALELFIGMCLNGVESDLFTYGSVFKAIAAVKYLQFGRQVHGKVLKLGYDSKALNVNNAIADAYSKCGSLEDARKVFESMETKDLISWTTMLTAYVQCSEGEKALNIFSQMRNEGFTPNEFSFASILVGCASLCLLDCGQQLHGLLCKSGLEDHECVESALIDMYAKCGNIIEAEKVFRGIDRPDVVSWTAIISAYAHHGLTRNALELFQTMEASGIKANTVTLLCVLFACSHGGMVDEGIHYFQSMEERYGLVPEMEHYACIVDLLGRVGRLNDAMEFINSMPIEPTDMVWQTLLGACRVHRNVELGELAAKKIISVRPEHSATYVLLASTYIEMGSLEDGLSLRNMMKDRSVRKEPGFSWISVKGRVHKFFAGDQHHPQKEDIYSKLDELWDKMKAMGYVPDLRYILQEAGE